MIKPKDFTNALIKNNLGPLVQVPCSYFKNLLNYIIATNSMNVINPVNEGLAMGIASGHYLSTGKLPIVMMQNSGLMNTLNALTSLNQIYQIPVFYVVTWRGEGGVGADAPEHDVVGENLEKIMDTFQIPYEIIDDQLYSEQIERLATKARKTNKPVALIVKKNTFDEYKLEPMDNGYEMDRYEVVQKIKEQLASNSLFISSTGFPSRDSFTVNPTKDFYMMGSMGHTLALGLGVAENTKERTIILDGDASSLMHLGGMGSFDPYKHKNLVYIVLDNEVCESTGCQPTVSKKVNFALLAKAFGFEIIELVKTKDQLQTALTKIQEAKNKSVFLHIKINFNTTHKSMRVSEKYSAPEVKELFMNEIEKFR